MLPPVGMISLQACPPSTQDLAVEPQGDSTVENHGATWGVWSSPLTGQVVEDHPQRSWYWAHVGSRFCPEVPHVDGCQSNLHWSQVPERVWEDFRKPLLRVRLPGCLGASFGALGYKSKSYTNTLFCAFSPNWLQLPPIWSHSLHFLSFSGHCSPSANILLLHCLILGRVPSYWFYQIWSLQLSSFTLWPVS